MQYAARSDMKGDLLKTAWRILPVVAISYCFAHAATVWAYACPPGYYSIGGGQDAGGFQGCAPLGQGPSVPEQPVWESRWAAIAVANGAFGTAGGWASAAEARSAALQACVAHGGHNCSVTIEYHDQCAALAWGDNYVSSYRSPDKAEAETNALRRCEEKSKNCKLFHSDCSYPQRVH